MGFVEPLGAIMTQPGRKTGLWVSTLENDFTDRVMELFLSDMFAWLASWYVELERIQKKRAK